MFRLRRWYNQNSKTIWKVTGIVAFCIIILQLFNYFAKEKNSNAQSNLNTQIPSQKEYTDLSLSTDKSVLSNDKISSGQLNSIETINSFFKYCNEGKVKEAYELLTDECKEKTYPKLRDFKEGYYKIVFDGKKKNISLENWTGNIYKVDITDDLLSTGIYNESSTRQDYITIKEIDGNYKLNINRYIDTTDINKSNIFYDKIEINVEKKDIYMDYEIYTFKIKNSMDNPILLDNLKDINSMYLEDKNNIKYSAYTHEISQSELLINARETRTIKVKYYNKYISQKKIEKVAFSKVIIDYYSYINLKDSNNFNNYRELKIDI